MKKAKRWVAAVLAASMVFSQTVYAQEYTAEESTVEIENAVDVSATETEESSVEIEETEEYETESMEETVSSIQQESIVEGTDASDSETTETMSEEESVEQELDVSEASAKSEIQTYNQTIVTGKAWLYLYNYINYGDEEYLWTFTDGNKLSVSVDDPSVCKVMYIYGKSYGSEEQRVDMKLQGLNVGKTTLTVKDADGSILFKYNVTVNKCPDDAVIFEDDALQGKMLASCDENGDGYLTEEELAQRVSISIDNTYMGEQVHSLKGLEKLKNLEVLSLDDCKGISDFSMLNQLSNLEMLYLVDSSFNKLSDIAECTNLQTLWIENCDISSWDGLEKLINLESISIHNTNFSSGALLKNMQTLRYLNLDDNKNFTDIQSLAGLKNLRVLYLEDTGVSDEDKWNFADIQDMVLKVGDTAEILKYEGLISIDTEFLDGEECFTSGRTAIKPGTAKLHISYTDTLNKDINIVITDADDQTLESDYQGDIDTKSDDEDDITHILGSNGVLWTTSPEVKKVKSGVKKYVADYVYADDGNGNFNRKQSKVFYVDSNDVLWSENHQKIAENIVELKDGGAVDKNGNFYDIYANAQKPVSNVKKWAAAGIFTFILKTDGSLWERNGYQNQEEFSKIADSVIDVVQWSYNSGAYLKADGTVVTKSFYSSKCYEKEYNVNAASLGKQSWSYYDKAGNLYLDFDGTNIGKLTIADEKSIRLNGDLVDLILSDDGGLYIVSEDKTEVQKIDSNAAKLYHGDYCPYPYYDNEWYYQKKDGTYYTIGSSEDDNGGIVLNKVDSAVISWTKINGTNYLLFSSYGGHEQAFVKSGTVFLDHVIKLWANNSSKVYALRTDGSIWNVTNSPVKVGSLSEEEPEHEHTIVKDLAIAATTEQPGKTEGSHCSECGEILTQQETTVVTAPLIEAKADDKGGITVSWKKVGYAEGYTVYRKNSSNEEWQRVADVKGKDTISWTDTTGEMCTAYTYTVSAYMNENGKTITGDFDSKGVTATVLPAVVILKNAVDNGKNGVDVTWEKVTGATGYRIYRKTADTGWKGLATVKPDSATTYTDTSAAAGITYTYTVRAYKTVNGKDVYGGFDTTGVSASVKKNDQALGTVVLDKAVDSTRGGIILSWKAVDGAENSGGSWQKVTDVTTDKLSYEDPTGVTGKTYTYTVRAFKKVNGKEVFGGFDSKGLTATKLPAKVTLKEAKVNVDGTITVSWNKMSTATGYRVFRKEAGGSWKGLITLTSNTATNYTDKNVEEGKSYTYTVRAYKVYDGKTVYGSFDANGKTAAVPVNMLSTVKLVSAAASSGRKITVSWEKEDNCQGYIVYRKEAGKGWARLAKAAGSSLTSYTDASGVAGTNYTYTVRAYKTVKGKEVLGGFDTKGVSAQCKN